MLVQQIPYARYHTSDGSYYEKRIDAKGTLLSDECIDDEIPFEIPENWEWVRLKSLGEIVGGGTPKTHDSSLWSNESDGIPWITPADMKNVFGQRVACGARYLSSKGLSKSSARLMPKGAVIMSSRAPIGYLAIATQAISTNQGFKSVVPYISKTNEWILLALNAFMSEIKNRATGTTFKEISGSEFGGTIIPLPPLAEQHRIVEKVNELTPLIEEYGALEDAREKLDAELPDRLRKSLLQMAVEGKLVSQNPDDEPASVLLERIRAERAKLLAEKKIKFPKDGESIIYRTSDGCHYEKRIDAKGNVLSDECIDDEIPFEIPESWEWTRLRSLFDMQAGKNIGSSEISINKTKEKSIPCFGGNGIRGFVVEANRMNSHQIIGRQGALCGCINYATGPFYATEHAVVVSCFGGIGDDWAGLILKGLNLNQYATATAQPGLAVAKIANVLVPLPPLAEQQRIVERMDKFLSIITSQ